MEQSDILTRKAAGEMAAEFMYHFMVEDIGTSEEDAINAASNIYAYFSDDDIDIEELFGFK